MQLEGRQWKKFLIADVADIESGQNINEDERVKGNIPYISASAQRNGVTGFVANNNSTLETRCLSVNSNGSVGFAFYHPYAALYSNDCRKLRPHFVGAAAARFIANQITAQRDKYSYGYKFSTARMRRQFIFLPVTTDGTPDFEFMEQFVRERETRLVRQYLDRCRAELIDSPAQGGGERKFTWRSFAVRDIFDRIRRGKRLKTADHIAGDKPYVSSTATNNGIDGFIGNTSGTRTFSNCLTVANSGSVGEAFWHSYEFIASDHVTAFESARINRYSGLFIATLMRRLTEKYSFNREINDVRVRRERILLPVADDGSPDFAYMEQYVKHLIAQLLNRYLGR